MMDEWVDVGRRGKHGRPKRGGHRRDVVVVTNVVNRVHGEVQRLQHNEAWCQVKDAVDDAMKCRGDAASSHREPVRHVYGLGFGPLSRLSAAREQAAVALCMAQRWGSSWSTYDPVYSKQDVQDLQRLGGNVLDTNWMETIEPMSNGWLILWMPHCEGPVYGDVLHWALPCLDRVVLVGNDVTQYEADVWHEEWRDRVQGAGFDLHSVPVLGVDKDDTWNGTYVQYWIRKRDDSDDSDHGDDNDDDGDGGGVTVVNVKRDEH